MSIHMKKPNGPNRQLAPNFGIFIMARIIVVSGIWKDIMVTYLPKQELACGFIRSKTLSLAINHAPPPNP